MALDNLKFYLTFAKYLFPILFQKIVEEIKAVKHRYTYKATSNVKNIVVIGGSFAGVELVKRLCQTLPTGYKVVMIEKNSHFNFYFNFPRFSVISGYEAQAFIPYEFIGRNAPVGIYSHIRNSVTSIEKSQVLLESGDIIEYAYVVVATGSAQSPPAKLKSTSMDNARAELCESQNKIRSAANIAIVGGGAVGIEVATDIKSYFPEKKVTLVHSQQQLLPQFGLRLHDHTLAALNGLGVITKLGEKPHIHERFLQFKDEKVEEFDLIIPCTGQIPNSALLEELAPLAISKETNRILVESTLQISDPDYPNVYAFGDVAETGGPRMARSSYFQSRIVLKNILDSIENKKPNTPYIPIRAVEGAIKLTLGQKDWTMYTMDDNGNEMLITGSNGKDDLDIRHGWRLVGGSSKDFELHKISNS